MKITAHFGPWQAIATDEDNESAIYVVDRWIPENELFVHDRSSGKVPAVIELRAHFGGRAPIALLGGYVDARNDSIPVEVGESLEMTVRAQPTCSSSSGLSLVPGLPPEFAETVVETLLRTLTSEPIDGVIVVDRAAYSEVESSSAVFARAARVLRAVQSALLGEHDPLEAINRILRGFEPWGY